MWDKEAVRRVLHRLPGGWLLMALYRYILGSDARYASLWRRKVPGLFQPFATTQMDRYPDLFSVAREMLGDGPDGNLLSFGCSTGEEVFSLRRYFPQSRIHGIDINPRNIARCRRHLRRRKDKGLSFAVASAVTGDQADRYDAIFAMAVFRHGELGDRPPDCDHLIRFVDFERSVSALASSLRPGGLLIIGHANFRFADTEVARGFDLLKEVPRNPTTPIYDKDNRYMTAQPDLEGAIFQRRLHSGDF